MPAEPGEQDRGQHPEDRADQDDGRRVNPTYPASAGLLAVPATKNVGNANRPGSAMSPGARRIPYRRRVCIPGGGRGPAGDLSAPRGPALAIAHPATAARAAPCSARKTSILLVRAN